MDGSVLSDDDRDRAAGQVWVIEQGEHPVGGECSALARAALAGADIVFYDRAFSTLVAELLPPGRYAELLPADTESDAPALAARASRLASEGWRVVQLVPPRRGWGARLGAASERRPPGGAVAASYAFTANGLAG